MLTSSTLTLVRSHLACCFGTIEHTHCLVTRNPEEEEATLAQEGNDDAYDSSSITSSPCIQSNPSSQGTSGSTSGICAFDTLSSRIVPRSLKNRCRQGSESQFFKKLHRFLANGGPNLLTNYHIWAPAALQHPAIARMTKGKPR